MKFLLGMGYLLLGFGFIADYDIAIVCSMVCLAAALVIQEIKQSIREQGDDSTGS